MPLYDFECKKCEAIFEVTCKIAEKDDKHACPECKSTKTESIILSAPMLADSFSLGINAKQKGFREVLNKIHKRTPGSTLDKTTNL